MRSQAKDIPLLILDTYLCYGWYQGRSADKCRGLYKIISRLIYVRAINRRLLTHDVMADSQPHDNRSQALLQRVAGALGLSTEAFYSDAPGEAGQLLILMRLWSSIEDRQARQRILMAARHEFERFNSSRAL